MPEPIRRALISVHDKTGVVEFARALTEFGVEILSSGGTFKALRDAGIKAREVSEYTGAPEMMDGRVKTLHPKIHGGILARRDNPADLAQAKAHGIDLIDLVAVSLYPFPKEPSLEMIDVGGPTLLRAAAKNWPWVTVVPEHGHYDEVIENMRWNRGAVEDDLRRRLAAKSFIQLSGYDMMISMWLGHKFPTPLKGPGSKPATPDSKGFPDTLELYTFKACSLRYGENPHQYAALYTGFNGSWDELWQRGNKELSYNNLLDADAAWRLAREFDAPACVIAKHTNPCAVAVGRDVREAVERALTSDPMSAYGGILAVNQELDRAMAEILASKENFFEVVMAPSYGAGAVEALREGARWGKNLRILGDLDSLGNPGSVEIRSILGGWLVQTPDTGTYEKFESVTVPVDDATRADLLFAWTVAKHAKSNAIVLARDGTLVGLGAGQVSRVDAAQLAVRKAGERARGAVAASDAFFPFADGVEALLDAGVRAIVHPGGSIRDAEVIEAARKRGVPMVLTGMRHFRH